MEDGHGEDQCSPLGLEDICHLANLTPGKEDGQVQETGGREGGWEMRGWEGGEQRCRRRMGTMVVDLLEGVEIVMGERGAAGEEGVHE